MKWKWKSLAKEGRFFREYFGAKQPRNKNVKDNLILGKTFGVKNSDRFSFFNLGVKLIF